MRIASECDFECDAGYIAHETNPIQMILRTDPVEFELKGCYLESGSSFTLDQKAERLIADRNILHVDASYDDGVTDWNVVDENITY